MPVAKLDNAPRCRHTKLNGQPCAAPARRGVNYCVFHAAEHSKTPDYILHVVEDAMTLQHSLFQVMRLLTEKTVDTKRVALMLYALQIAASNLKRLHQESEQIAQSADVEQEQSWIKQLLDTLQMPMTEEERAAVLNDRDYDPAEPPLVWPPIGQPQAMPDPPPDRERFDIKVCIDEKAAVEFAPPREAPATTRASLPKLAQMLLLRHFPAGAAGLRAWSLEPRRRGRGDRAPVGPAVTQFPSTLVMF